MAKPTRSPPPRATCQGVAAVATRTTTTLSIWVDGGQTKVQGTVIGVPSTGPPIDTLSITAGKAFAP